MNQPPRRRPPMRRPAASRPAENVPQPEPEPEYEEEYLEEEYLDDEEEEEYYAPPPPPPSRRTQNAQRPQQSQRMQQPQRGQQSQRQQQQSRKGQGRQGQYGQYDQRGNRYRNVPVQSRRDPFPMVIGAVIGALVVGLVAVVYLLARGNGPATTTNTPAPNAQVTTVDTSGDAPPTSAGGEPPRMPLEEFIKLYEDPAKRPLVIDVRNKDVYDQGHIKGAESWPEADIDARVVKLPKDKMIVAYCQ